MLGNDTEYERPDSYGSNSIISQNESNGRRVARKT